MGRAPSHDRRQSIWNFVIVTTVTVLIWYLAAVETRVEQRLTARVDLKVADPSDWRIDPGSIPVTLTVEGSRRAIRNAEQQLRRVSLELTPTSGAQTLDLTSALAADPQIEAAGVSVVSANPDVINVTLDELIVVDARVRAKLPAGVEVVDEVEVTPPQVAVRLPKRVHEGYQGVLEVEAHLDRDEIDRLEPGVRHTLDSALLRLPESVPSLAGTAIEAQSVSVAFTIRSRTSELALTEPVRVHLSGPPEDSQYLVEMSPKQLREVTILLPGELIPLVESGEASVVAVVHLKSREKEDRIERKPLACFMVLLPDGSAVLVEGRVGPEGDARPIIELTVTEQRSR